MKKISPFFVLLALSFLLGVPFSHPYIYSDVSAAHRGSVKDKLSLAYAPANPAAAQNAVKIHVVEPGIQLVTGVDLIANGVPVDTPLSNIQIADRGTEIAVEAWDNGNGTLDASDSLRFYAHHSKHSPTVGDYWNHDRIFWLTYSGVNGQRMVNRNVVPTGNSGATIRPIGFEKGIWEENKIYESTMPGVDGDNWFHDAMIVDSSQSSDPSSYPILSVALNHTLPLAASNIPSEFMITGSSRSVATHALQANLGTDSKTTNWTNLQYYESFSHVISSTVAHPSTLQLTLLPGSLTSDIRIDKIYWEQPVNLDFGNGGAAFSGVSGTWRYQLANVAGDAALYDVTVPSQPQRLQFSAGSNPQFEDGPEPRDYILATTADLQQPELSKHEPITWPTNARAHSVYIAYSYFHDELQPLLDWRRSQGYEVQAVDLQSIYDSWSFGQVSPHAVRNMLQYASHNWELSPVAAVAVGDSTYDPKNYLGRMNGNANRNIFPAFLESVDPWLGETACENCFAQLDDPHPLDGIEDRNFQIDLWFGRFSVQDEDQLTAVVDKIINYETAPDSAPSNRNVSVHLADNYVRADSTLDSAGDFAAEADEIIENHQSSKLQSERVYYTEQVDPTSPYYDPDRYSEPHWFSTSAAVQDRAFELLNSGPALATFIGHSNHFQLGRTEQNGGYIVGFNELLQLQGDPFVMLQMSCYTSQFQYVSPTGTTFDERLLRQPHSGAVAVWGPAGLSVNTGHPYLLQGFHEKLAEQLELGTQPLMGELVEAGYDYLFENSTCCQDVRKTFMLLGDPLTPLRIASSEPSETPTPVTPTPETPTPVTPTPETPTPAPAENRLFHPTFRKEANVQTTIYLYNESAVPGAFQIKFLSRGGEQQITIDNIQLDGFMAINADSIDTLNDGIYTAVVSSDAELSSVVRIYDEETQTLSLYRGTPDSAATDTLFFGPFFKTLERNSTVHLTSAGVGSATVAIEALNTDGQVAASINGILIPEGGETITADMLDLPAGFTGWIRASANQPLAGLLAPTSELDHIGLYAPIASLTTSLLSTRRSYVVPGPGVFNNFYPRVYGKKNLKGGVRNTSFFFGNPDGATLSFISSVYELGAQNQIFSEVGTIPSQGFQYLLPSDYLEVESEYVGSMVASSDGPLAIGEITESTGGDLLASYGSSLTSSSIDVASKLVMPYIGHDSERSSILTIQNVGASQADVTISFVNQAGLNELTLSLTGIAPNGSEVFHTEDSPVLRDGFVGSVIITSDAFVPISATIDEFLKIELPDPAPTPETPTPETPTPETPTPETPTPETPTPETPTPETPTPETPTLETPTSAPPTGPIPPSETPTPCSEISVSVYAGEGGTVRAGGAEVDAEKHFTFPLEYGSIDLEARPISGYQFKTWSVHSADGVVVTERNPFGWSLTPRLCSTTIGATFQQTSGTIAPPEVQSNSFIYLPFVVE